MTENIDRALGRIEGKLGWLVDEQVRVSQNGRLMDKELEIIRMNAKEQKRQINNMDIRIRNVEKPVAEFSRWRERIIGAALFITAASAMIGGLMANYWQKIISFFMER